MEVVEGNGISLQEPIKVCEMSAGIIRSLAEIRTRNFLNSNIL